MLHRLLRDPRRLRAAFGLVMVTLAATMGWLGWTLIENDRQLAIRRADERRDTSADQAVAALQQRLADWRSQLDTALASGAVAESSSCRDDCVMVRVTPSAVTRAAGRSLIYDPAEEGSLAIDPVAVSLLQSAAHAHSLQRYDAALATYSRLEARGAAGVAGMPAALAARAGRLVVYHRAGNAAAEVNEARALARDLDDGRWPVSFSTYKHLVSEARDRLPAPEQRVSVAESLADGVTEFWDQWKAGSRDRRSLTVAAPGGPLFVMWTGTDQQAAALVAAPSFIDRELLAPVTSSVADRGVRLTLDSPQDGRAAAEGRLSGDRPAVRHADDTGLPWTVRAFTVAGDDPLVAARRTMLVSGLGVLVAFVLAGGWFVGRSITRELEVARLKTDFVAAVSHEFRTPLTTIVQLAELLKGGRVASDADRQAYYDLLHGEGSRLRRLVERLLTFGRVDSGQSEYRMTRVDLSDLARSCLADFQAAQPTTSHELTWSGHADVPPVAADREALTTVLWNLLENAVKYSPGGGRIEVAAAASRGGVEISVSDSGLGVPEAERARIFEPFVRGAAARDHQIRGTGVGLALAHAIVRAHGGELTVDSVVGQGSIFRIRLPIA